MPLRLNSYNAPGTVNGAAAGVWFPSAGLAGKGKYLSPVEAVRWHGHQIWFWV